MRQRQGTILKKCQCANQDRCSHKWTLRYWADGRQRELSFADELDGQGRPRYGSGKRLAHITGVLDEAVRAGKITMHRCGGIILPDNGGNGNHDDFVFPSHAQLLTLTNGSEEPPVSEIKFPLTIWLMRGCGLRIEEALAVQKSCFRDGGTVLRVFEQASRDGRKTRPLMR
jgi:hypothetical protein